VQPDPSAASLPDTFGSAIAVALDAYETLVALGEEIEDEWQYVQDLADAWRTRLDEVDAARGDESLAPAAGAAIARLRDEASLIADPHRAIDWLSTFPQVALVALGERP
jgi:hypothetical protein